MLRWSGIRSLVCLGLLTLVLLPAAASAAQPSIDQFRAETYDVPLADCGTFLLTEDIVEDVTVTTFFDSAGNPIRVQAHLRTSGLITNSATGATFVDRAGLNVHVDLRSGEVAQIGKGYNITVPGRGGVVRGVGRLVFNADGEVVFEAGQQDVIHSTGGLTTDEIARYCAGLA
jgi:hypothetical protein